DIEDDQWDTSMVAEYGDEIFEYMRTLEKSLDFVIKERHQEVSAFLSSRLAASFSN
ncbi:hypothetical protein KCU78_g10770, partial [Aureobasidium melanogenum]